MSAGRLPTVRAEIARLDQVRPLGELGGGAGRKDRPAVHQVGAVRHREHQRHVLLDEQHPGAQLHRNASTYDQHFHDIELVPGTRLAQLYPDKPSARVNSIHHQGIKRVAPDFVVEAFSLPDRVPEAIRLSPGPGRGYIAATQWHPEFHRAGSQTLDDSAILNDFLAACGAAQPGPLAGIHTPLHLRDRASRLLRNALKSKK